MKPIAKIFLAVALVLAAANPSFGLWGVAHVSKERAKEMGMEVRSHAAGPVDVRIELQFKTEGELKNVREVNLRVSDGEKVFVTAPLREERPNPDRVAVSFVADRTRLDKLTLWVMAPESAGGTVYELRVKEFVDLDKVR